MSEDIRPEIKIVRSEDVRKVKVCIKDVARETEYMVNHVLTKDEYRFFRTYFNDRLELGILYETDLVSIMFANYGNCMDLRERVDDLYSRKTETEDIEDIEFDPYIDDMILEIRERSAELMEGIISTEQAYSKVVGAETNMIHLGNINENQYCEAVRSYVDVFIRDIVSIDDCLNELEDRLENLVEFYNDSVAELMPYDED